MKNNGITLLEPGPGREAMKRRCREAKVKIKVLERLIAAELDQVGKRKRWGLHEQFDEILTTALEDTVDNGG